MLKKEAIWFSEKINKVGIENITPVLNAGSGSLLETIFIRPWIYLDLFIKIPHKKIINLEIYKGYGIDLVCDITSKKCDNKIKEKRIKSIFCTNVLEHINNYPQTAKKLLDLLPVKGYLFVSVPKAFPYHPNPIDNMYRPNPKEIKLLFPKTKLIYSEVIGYKTFLIYLLNNPYVLLLFIIRLLLPFYKFSNWKNLILYLKWWNKEILTSCVVLQKIKN